MFINLSNHALQNWSLKQKEEAVKYGELIVVESVNSEGIPVKKSEFHFAGFMEY